MDQCKELDVGPVTEVKIDAIRCSSPQVMNALFDDIAS